MNGVLGSRGYNLCTNIHHWRRGVEVSYVLELVVPFRNHHDFAIEDIRVLIMIYDIAIEDIRVLIAIED